MKLLQSAKQNQHLTEELDKAEIRETKLSNQINDLKTISKDFENQLLDTANELEKYKKEIHKSSTEVKDGFSFVHIFSFVYVLHLEIM